MSVPLLFNAALGFWRAGLPLVHGAIMLPVARAALSGAIFLALAPVHAATLEGTATVDGRPAVHAVVYLEKPEAAPSAASPPAPPPPVTPARVVMDQKNLVFRPDVLPVMRGTVIEFTNSDDVQHNVFSPSAIAGKFNLGTYGPGAMSTVTLDQVGDVRVLCNIHMEMEAHILVLDGPYFATVAQDGRYQIPNVPAGTYTLKIWQENWLPFRQTVDLPEGGNLTVNVTAGK